MSDRVIIARALAASVLVRYLCWSRALRSSAPRMVTFTTLAESKCQPLLSRHTSPVPGSSTSTATAETRPRRAAWISRLILAASAPWEDELQTAGGLAARPALASAGTARNPDNTMAAKAAATALTRIPPTGSRTKIAPPHAGSAAPRRGSHIKQTGLIY